MSTETQILSLPPPRSPMPVASQGTHVWNAYLTDLVAGPIMPWPTP